MNQQCAVFLTFVLLASQCAPAAASAASEARDFLRRCSGGPPKADQLASLKTVNPEAYAIVNALLAKRSMGLLNTMRPSISFSASNAQQHEQQAAERSPEVFRNLAHQMLNKADVPYPDLQPASIQSDQVNWKPPSSTMDENAMVQNVLGAVADVQRKTALLTQNRVISESSFSTDATSSVPKAFQADHLSRPEAPRPPAPVAPKAAATPVKKPAAPVPHVNSYLKGLDMSGAMPTDVAVAPTKKAALIKKSSANLLSSFSWEEPKPTPKPLSHKAPHLMSWLDDEVATASTPKALKAAATAPQEPSNRYMMDLN